MPPVPAIVGKLMAEFIGMFFILHVICLSVNGAMAEGVTFETVPLTIGSSFVVAIYCFGAVSGAHLNPAVTTGIFTAGQINIFEWFTYIIAQVVGSILSAIIAARIASEN